MQTCTSRHICIIPPSYAFHTSSQRLHEVMREHITPRMHSSHQQKWQKQKPFDSMNSNRSHG